MLNILIMVYCRKNVLLIAPASEYLYPKNNSSISYQKLSLINDAIS